MSRFIIRGAFALAIVAGGLLAWSGIRPYDPAPWLADFAQLKTALAAGYANLDWKVSRGEVRPYELARATDSAIRAAGSDREARQALQRFVGAFEDGHLHLRRPHPILAWVEERVQTGFRRGPITGDMDGAAACGRLGFGADDSAPLLSHLPGYTPLPAAANAFQAGTFPLAGGATGGVIRIALFSADAYRPACERAWESVRATLPPGEPCDEACEDRIWAATHARMTDELEQRMQELEAAGARLVVVDVTGNGGGNEWVDLAARSLTRRTLRSPRAGFVRHPHWIPAFEEGLAAVERDLERTDVDSLRRAVLAEARARYAQALDEARTPCDVNAIWREPAPELPCRNIGSAELYSSGAFGWLAPGTVAGLGSAELLFWPGMRGPARGNAALPLVVLVDRRSASATEQFAAMLRDNDAARIVGERTYGAGCGFTRGGIVTTLENSGLVLRMPDCLRVRADGTNEVAGVEPDVAAGWAAGDDDAARAGKALAAVQEVMDLE